MKKVSWGVLSTAKIGTEKVIPAMQKGKYSEISAIASRNLSKAQKAADELGIPKAYGSYEELLADKEIDAIYNPLPNHLHVGWSVKALEAGKHVLCEKPLGMNFEDAEILQKEAKKFPDLKVMEAFMYRHHPQILKTKELVDNGAIGEVKNIHAEFYYYNIDPENIRNIADIGGGGLLDIGCYCISITRFLMGREPKRLCATIDYDPELKIDRLVSTVMDFGQSNSGSNITSTFTCSTQLFNHQSAEITGTKGRIKLHVPFTPAPDEQAKIVLETGNKKDEFVFDACDQYTIQGDLFSLAILNNTDVPTPLSDGLANMKVIDKIKLSAETNSWVSL